MKKTTKKKRSVWGLFYALVCFGMFLLDVLFCPVSLLFAAFWNSKLPFLQYLH